MGYGLDNRVESAVPVAQKSVAAAAITSSYTLVGSLFLTPIISLVIISTLDQAVQISFDGITDHLAVNAGVTIHLDFKNNKSVLSGAYGIYVKEIGNPTTGSLYISSFTL